MADETANTEEIFMQECLDINFTVLAFLGLWIPTSFRGTVKGSLYQIYSVFSVALFVIGPTISELIHVYTVVGDMQKMVEGMSLAVTHISWMVKVYTALRHRNRIQMLFDRFQEPIFSNVNVMSTHWVRGAMQNHLVATRTFYIFCFASIWSWALYPFFDSNGVQLPVTGWYPVDLTKSSWFAIIFIYQIISAQFLAASNVSYDSILAGASGLICGQIHVLCDKLEDKYRRGCNTTNNITRSKDSIMVSYDVKTRNILDDCVEHHLNIIGFIKETRDVFKVITFMQFVGSCIAVCFTAFKLTVVPTFGELLGMFMYLLCVLFELYFVCYFGNELIIESEGLRNAAYGSPWYEMSVQNRRYIFIIMEQTKRPLKITAAIFTLSIVTFTSVLRSSYSYYALLKHVNQ